MRREFHLRSCEGGGVRFPSATRLVIGFEHEEDARRVVAVLGKRLARFGLTLHPDKLFRAKVTAAVRASTAVH